jgi:hypothetical protein
MFDSQNKYIMRIIFPNCSTRLLYRDRHGDHKSRVRVMVFNATFNNNSAIAVGFIGGGNWSTQRKPPNCRKSLTNFIT